MTAGDTGAAAAILTIDLDAIVENWRMLADLVLPAECAAVVKANAYGLGVTKVAPAIRRAGCRTFFVATLDEAVLLRQVLNETDAVGEPAAADPATIYVFHGCWEGDEELVVGHRLSPVLNSLGQIDALARFARGRGETLPAALHIDTGMSRLGLPADELDTLAAAPERLGGIRLTHIISHLACADEPAHPLNDSQLAAFRAALPRLPYAPASLANSAGIFLGPAFHGKLVRPGLALYGGAPVKGAANPMRGVVRLEGRILQVREIAAGTTVGYGATYQAAVKQKIATVGVGYADGFLRSLGNRAVGYLGGHAVSLVGRISMDLVTFDITGLPMSVAHPGALIELIGPLHSIDALADEAGTVAYELLTALGDRYQRIYRGGC